MWLRLNPAWGNQIGPEALRLVTAFGYRQVFDDEAFDQDVVLRQKEGHDYFETETAAEEGWATEALVSADSTVGLAGLVALPVTGNYLLKTFVHHPPSLVGKRIMLILFLLLNLVLGRRSAQREQR